MQVSELQAALINSAAAAASDVVAAVAGKKIRVFQLFYATLLADTVKFGSNTTNLVTAMATVPGVPVVLPFSMGPWFETAVGEAFTMTKTVATQCSGRILYTQD